MYSNSLEQKNNFCIHTRLISSYANDKSAQRYVFLSSHLEGCSICQSALERYGSLEVDLISIIPLVRITSSVRDNLKSEMNILFQDTAPKLIELHSTGHPILEFFLHFVFKTRKTFFTLELLFLYLLLTFVFLGYWVV